MMWSLKIFWLQFWFYKQTDGNDCVTHLKPYLTQNVPVFGTEEALVEPMLLALEPTIPFPALSAKKSKGQNKERGLHTIE